MFIHDYAVGCCTELLWTTVRESAFVAAWLTGDDGLALNGPCDVDSPFASGGLLAVSVLVSSVEPD